MPTPATDTARFVERFGSALTAAGLARLPARVFACLLASADGRMTAAELGEALDVSPAAISGAVRYLQQMINASAVYGPLRAALVDGVSAVGGERTAAGRRLALSAEFLDFLSLELEEVARRWDKRRAELSR